MIGAKKGENIYRENSVQHKVIGPLLSARQSGGVHSLQRRKVISLAEERDLSREWLQMKFGQVGRTVLDMRLRGGESTVSNILEKEG